jgi:hypothetical protein
VEVLLVTCCASRGKGTRWDGEARMSVCGSLEAQAERGSHELARTGRRHDYVACIGNGAGESLGYRKSEGGQLSSEELTAMASRGGKSTSSVDQ